MERKSVKPVCLMKESLKKRSRGNRNTKALVNNQQGMDNRVAPILDGSNLSENHHKYIVYISQDDDSDDSFLELRPLKIKSLNETNGLRSSLSIVQTFKLANELIKFSRYLNYPIASELICLDCLDLPILPVTGQCGHTRCKMCIVTKGACPCGTDAPKPLLVNPVIQELVDKMTYVKRTSRTKYSRPQTISDNNEKALKREIKSNLEPQGLLLRSNSLRTPRMPMTDEARYSTAQKLVQAGKYLDAAAHFARVAVTSGKRARLARIKLVQTINKVCTGKIKIDISRKLRQCVREQSIHSWLSPSDLECVVCTCTYTDPVTTPCGHTYCRACIKRLLRYRERCALCLRPLHDFNIDKTNSTLFLSSFLAFWPQPHDQTTDRQTFVIPVFTSSIHVSYVTFPGMPCPLLMFEPRYRLMVQRVIENGTRRFAMLASADYGTVLEIRDCVLLRDNSFIISTVGVSRFTVIKRFVEDGIDFAQIETLVDIPPPRLEVGNIHTIAIQIYCRALEWLSNMDDIISYEIRNAFGNLPMNATFGDLEVSTDGPNWLWWLVTVMPLHIDIKILILSSRSLYKRMLAISQALDIMNTEDCLDEEEELFTVMQQWRSNNRNYVYR